MIRPIYPCIWFNNNAKEAATFYSSVFENTTIIADTPMVVKWSINGFNLMGLNGGPAFSINPSVSFYVNCETIEEVNQLWAKLIDGGTALMPLNEYPWSKRYGWLKDKFGVTWQIALVKNPGEKWSIKPSLLFTGPYFGKAEEAINCYSSVFETSSKDILVHYPENDAHSGKLMYAEFQLNGYKLIAMDGPGNHDFTFNEGVSFVVECETQEEIDACWNKLLEGGKEQMCGWLKDRFGISWQIVPTVLGVLMQDPTKAPGVFKAFQQMKKMIIADLMNA